MLGQSCLWNFHLLVGEITIMEFFKKMEIKIQKNTGIGESSARQSSRNHEGKTVREGESKDEERTESSDYNIKDKPEVQNGKKFQFCQLVLGWCKEIVVFHC